MTRQIGQSRATRSSSQKTLDLNGRAQFVIWRSARDTRAHLRIMVPLSCPPAIITSRAALKSTQRASQLMQVGGDPGCNDLSRYGWRIALQRSK
jgi:hypothetical protein